MKKTLSILAGLALVLVMPQAAEVAQDPNILGALSSQAQVVLQFPCPAEIREPEGLAWGDGYLWFASQNRGIYKLDPSDGSVLDRIPEPSGAWELHGLAYDGEYLWAAGFSNHLYKIDPSVGSVVEYFGAPGSRHIEGLAWGDGFLWLSRDNGKVYKVDPSTGTAIDSFPTGHWDAEGLAYAHGFLWYSHFDPKVRLIDPNTGSVLGYITGPGYDVSGLAWDGEYLWVDSPIDKMICKLKVSASPNEVWVDENFRAGGHNRGHTWGYDAFNRIQDGIDALSFWGKVNVAAGTYNEIIDFRGVPIRLESESGPNNTIIHGNGYDNIISGSTGSTLKGFTISDVSSTKQRFAIQIRSVTMTITGNIIRDSSFGIYTSYGQRPLITNNVIRNNRKTGIYADGDAAPIIANNTIVYNGEPGIYVEQGKGKILNNIVYWNSGPGIASHSPTGLHESRNNNVFRNSPMNYYLCGPGKGDISVEPHFLIPERLLRLKPMSPCLGAGILTPEVPRIDLEGNPRPSPEGSNPDIGAYEQPEVFNLTLDTEGAGTTKPPPQPYEVFSGIELKIHALPDKGAVFSHWSGDVENEDTRSNPLVFVMDSDKWIKANFARDFWLRLTAGKGGTTDPAPGKHIFDPGAEVSVTAVPKEGYRFVQWEGDISNSQNPLKLTMLMNVKIKAQFIKPCVLSVACSEGGTVQPVPGEHTYDRGTTVKLTAIPDLHYLFSGWSGAVSHAQNPCAYTIGGDCSITAHFLRKIYAPDNCGGSRVENRALFAVEYLDVLSWQLHPDNADITKYRVYVQEGDSLVLLSEVGADVFQYQHRVAGRDVQYTYAVVAVNSEDRMGELAFITVNGN